MSLKRRTFTTASLAALALPAMAQKKYDAGASDTEIRIGNIMPYSGPASIFGAVGKTQEAYFKMLNEQGGINGRKVIYLSYDDAYSPAKTVEHARKLVESDRVLALFCSLGTATNTAIVKYMNSKRVPHLFLLTGATKFSDPKTYPWTMPLLPTYEAEGRAYAKDILKNHPTAKIAALYQNDDFGKDYLRGLEEGLGNKTKNMTVARAPYEATDPTVDSQIVTLKASGADVNLLASVAKFTTQALRKMGELSWSPTRYLSNTSVSIDAVLKPAGLDVAKGSLSIGYIVEPADPQWANEPGFKAYVAFMDKYLPSGPKDSQSAIGYAAAQLIAHVLRQAGDNLTHSNVMSQATNIKDFDPGVVYPGIRVNTSPTKYSPFSQVQLIEFSGEAWKRAGPIVDTSGV